MLDLIEVVLRAMNSPGGIPAEYEPENALAPQADASAAAAADATADSDDDDMGVFLPTFRRAATPAVTFGRIDGSVPGPKRSTIIDGFNRPGSSLSVLLLTMGCGSVGITLTSATRGKPLLTCC